MPTITATIKAKEMIMYESHADGDRTIIAMCADGTGATSATNDVVYWDAGGNATNILTPAAGAKNSLIYSVNSRDYQYFVDGVATDLQKWNIDHGLSKWGIIAPPDAITLGAKSAGNVTLNIGRRYYLVFLNSTTQNFSDLNPISASTGPMTNQQQALTGLDVSSDPQVDMKVILATADGGDPTILYFLVQLSNATTTYSDNTPETNLLVANVYQETDQFGVDHGLASNVPPPNGSYPIKHRGRLFMANGEQLVFSKSLAEVTTSTGIIAGRYEEDWPPSNSLDVSPGAEFIRGLLSDGNVLYIGTELHIRRLLGDSPQNFQQPEVVFNDTGLCCQDVWQVVYLEGTPVGCMWLTPDFRVLGSDFNTFQNVGTPIQSTLNTINASAATNSFAMSTRIGPYNFYVLFIPTGSNTVPDTLCVFDMHLRKWYIWTCADLFSAGIYYINIAGIPRWIVMDSNAIPRAFSASLWLDRQTDPTPIGIASTIQTTWLDLGDPTSRKALNEIELETTDSSMLVSADGATNITTFNSPNNLVSNTGLATSPFGDFKVYLAGTNSKDRFYRFTLSSTSTLSSAITDIILGALSVEVFPIHKF